MTVKAILFDFGGVLVLSDGYPQRDLWEQRLGMEPGELPSRLFDSEQISSALVGQISVEEMWVGFGATLGLDAAESRKLSEDFFVGEYLNQELIAFAQSLRSRYRVAILSNAWTNARPLFTEWYHLDAVFDPLIISAEVGLAKPDPRIYHLAAERVGARPDEVVFLDDSLMNIEAAREVGFCGVHYQHNAQAIGEILRCLDGD